MAEKIVMTALSPTMETGTIATWSKKEGESVAAGDVLCEVETDKASMEYESTQEGVLLKIITAAGKEAKIGDAIAIIGEKGESIEALLAEIATAEQAADSSGGATEADASSTGSTTASGAATSVPAQGSGATAGGVHVPSTSDGVAGAQKRAERQGSGVSHIPAQSAADGDGWVRSSPLARKIAHDNNITIAAVSGSGPAGRVIRRDIEEALARGVPGGARAVSRGGAPGADVRIPLSGIRKVIARRTTESTQNVPHYYLSVAIDMGAIISARVALNKSLQGTGTKVSFNAFLMKFAAEALHRHPEVNASWQGDHIMQFGSIDIGLAVDVGNGLITPIVRNCLHKSVTEIDADIVALIEKARTNSLQSSEYQGATHTISNLGSFGIDSFAAIINAPGAAIWAIGKTAPTPVVDQNGQIVVRSIMQTTLSCDHRVIDGKVSAEYLSALKGLMENPALLLF